MNSPHEFPSPIGEFTTLTCRHCGQKFDMSNPAEKELATSDECRPHRGPETLEVVSIDDRIFTGVKMR